jgi:hypothetical protein
MFFKNTKKALLVFGLKRIAKFPAQCDAILALLEDAFAGRIEAKDCKRKIKELK